MTTLKATTAALLGVSIATLAAGMASAQNTVQAAAPAPAPEPAIVLAQATVPNTNAGQTAADVSGDEQPQGQRDIVVLGSQIRGARITGALPVSVVGAEQIEAVAAVSGADLFRTIPQLGGVTFNEQVLGGGNANAARGDVSTISLRGLGQGNTLILLNGRRTVLHPTSQAITGVVDSGIPTFGFNANAIPVGGLERVEVLRDGAAALYGSDAVAGVINNVLQSTYKGFRLDSQYGFAEGTNVKEFTVNGLIGTDFNEGRGNISLFASYAKKSKLFASDNPYTADADRRGYVAGTSYAAVNAFNGTSTTTPFGTFRALRTGGATSGVPNFFTGSITSSGANLTNASGQFHVQPTTNAGCVALTTTPGICYDDGNGVTEMTTPAANPPDFNLRFNSPKSFPGLTTQPSVNRINAFSFLNYEFSDHLDFFGELGFYRGETHATVGAAGSLANIPITVAANAYWNPLGPVGSPNRLPGLNLAQVPAAGLPIQIATLNYADLGARSVDVTTYQYRFLAGLRGDIGNWNWESAALYSWATAYDDQINFSSTRLQAAINKTTADAYNPFNGGCVTTPSIGDCTVNNQATIDSFRITATRRNKTTLALGDLKVSTPNLLDLWGDNKIGMAGGIEIRRETYTDDRSSFQAGVLGKDNTYTDSVTGIFYGSDLGGASTRPDIYGKRTVKSAYAELAIGLINRDDGITGIRSLDFQVAGRYEDYSDVGSVAKPKVAGSWEILQGMKVRGSWSQGFRAPNLEVINISVLDGVNNGVDYVLCEADLRARRITNFSQCSRTISVLRRSGGNKNLKPETSTSWSFGTVLEPPLPPGWGAITLTIDRYQIRQKDVVGLLDYQNGMNLDYLLRVGGQTNPNVVRDAPTADDIAAVAGTGLAPVGRLLFVVADFQNLLPIKVEGIDFQVDYRLRNTPVGNFYVNFNASRLLKYDVGVPPAVQQVIDAKAAGTINNGVAIQGGAGNVKGRDGQPRWRLTANATWTLGPVTIGAFSQYIADVYESAVLNATATPYPVKGQTTVNLYAQYTFGGESSRLLKGTTIQVGARNIFDKDPPFASAGYLSQLYAPTARYWYASLKKTFW